MASVILASILGEMESSSSEDTGSTILCIVAAVSTENTVLPVSLELEVKGDLAVFLVVGVFSELGPWSGSFKVPRVDLDANEASSLVLYALLSYMRISMPEMTLLS
jgi:hypothetical protein